MTSRTSVVLALVADNVTNLMLCFLLLLAMMWASVVCEKTEGGSCETEGRAPAPTRGLDTGALGSREPPATAQHVFTH